MTDEERAGAAPDKEYNRLMRQFKKLERDYRALSIMHEQTERLRNANEAAKELSNFYNRLLLKNTPGVTFMLDAELRFVLGSETAAALLGYADVREMVGQPFAPLFAKTMPSAWVAAMAASCKKVLEHGIQREWEEAVVPESGEETVLRITVAPADEQDGTRRGVVVVMNDITELARARREAETASNAKSLFLARMSHEIRTPMNAISGMTQIARSTDDLAKIRSCLDQIENSSAHLLRIVNDILDFSRIESGKMPLDAIDFSITDDIRFVLSMMEPRAAQDDITIRLARLDVTHDWLRADSLRLNQVLINLLSNAIKFSWAGSEVELRVAELSHKNGRGVYLFEVVDSGIGISDEQAARLFRPFEQADVGISRLYGGTGLGLAISKNLVEMMDGEIWMESSPGAGSRFSFTIECPARRQAANAAREDDEEKPPARCDLDGHRCLVVDDIDINREILLELLAETGLEMETAGNGREALKAFGASPEGYFDIILMDMQMPVMDGCTATREIRALGRADAKTVRIVAMTANVLPDDIRKSLECGMDAHLGKPIELDEVLAVLSAQLKVGQGRCPA